jgi:proline iminopeptidase
VPESERDGNLAAAYDRVLNAHFDQAVRLKAASDWVAWEDAMLSLEEGYLAPNPRYTDERFRVAFARLVTHYFSHAAWLEEDELLGNAHKLRDIPGVLLHGRLDLAGPADVAWQLSREWPAAELHFVPGGHTGMPK